MPSRYLFGPVTSRFVHQNLLEHSKTGECLPFGYQSDLPFSITQADTWDTLCQRLPSNWRPDFVVLDLYYTTIPMGLWKAPVPLIGLAADWNLLWHAQRRLAHQLDLVLTDTQGVERFEKEGIHHVMSANLFGLETGWLSAPIPAQPERDIDILFIGNLQPAVQRARLPWLSRLAALSRRWHVMIAQNIFDEPYRTLMRRARIAFNRSIRGECNMRAFEAAAAGALLFQEQGNREIGAYFRDRQECVLFDAHNLEALLTHYLENEPERRAVADRARSVVENFTYAKLWQGQVDRIATLLPTLHQRVRQRLEASHSVDLAGRIWQALGSRNPKADQTLIADLERAETKEANRAAWQNSLGLATAALEPEQGLWQVGRAFEGALRSTSQHPVARLNLAEALNKAGKHDAAIIEANKALRSLRGPIEAGAAPDESGDALAWLDAPHYPPGFDFFRVEWEQAAWQTAGDRVAEAAAKRRLLRWRLHALLAELTKESRHYYEAVVARPDLPTSRAALGCALARERQSELAIVHLRAAVDQNPFDLMAARALFQALKDNGDLAGQEAFAQERRLWAKAAARAIPVEPWFDTPVVAQSQPPSAATPPDQGFPFNIVWEGAQKHVQSLALVNRATCRQLRLLGHKLVTVPSGYHDSPEHVKESANQLKAFFAETRRQTADVYVRHQWPPRFTPPPLGHWVMMQPWEYGSLPCSWIEPMRDLVDEIWVASHWVRGCYIKSGIPADRVQVIRQGVDPDAFPAGVPPLALHTRKRFKFLFVGGTLHRKGIDILLDVYARTFTSRDDVCLVIKDMGAATFYRGETAERLVAELQAKAGAPEIEYSTQTLSGPELAGLYAACDCLVHPFRGEGFALPITEAMASGLPVVVTGYGPALDYCSDTTAYLIPAREVCFPEKRFRGEPTVDYPWLAEPDPSALEALLRRVIDNPQEAREKGQAARAHIRANFTWERSAAEIEARIRALREQPIRRFARDAKVESRKWTKSEFQPPAIDDQRFTINEQGITIHDSRSAINDSRSPTNDPRSTIHDSRSAINDSRSPTNDPRSRIHLSACLIVKNEETNLAPCLESILGVADELIVVDTGSTDRTKEIARQYGARVFEFPWVDSFAAARNESLRRATGDWIFWMDADDRLSADNRERLRQLVDRLRLSQPDAADGEAFAPFDAFVMTCRCLSGRGDPTATEVQHVRLFRNHAQLRWEHRIHEQILPAVRRLGGVPRFSDVVIEHTGYQDPAARSRKRERDLRLLHMEYAEQPDHPFTLFNLGMTYLDLQRGQDALPYLQKSLDLSRPRDSIVRKLYYMIVQCHRQLGRKHEALDVCRRGRLVYPQDAELLAQEALFLNEENDLAGAEQCYLKLLNDREAPHFASVPVGLNGYLTRHNLAVIYLRQQRAAEAELQWRAAIEEKPAFEPSWRGLEDLYVKQGRWQDLEALASGMEKQNILVNPASLDLARERLTRGEFENVRPTARGRSTSSARSGVFETTLHGHRLELHDPRMDRVLSGHLASGVPYEPFETRLALQHVREGDSVLDLGANVGYYTLLLARQVGPTGKVYAFEPDPDNFALLVRNVERNGYRNVTMIQKAAAAFAGTTRLYLSGNNSGDHRIHDSAPGRPFHEVETVRVDDILSDATPRLGLVKMDIQGAEGLALEGMKAVLARSKQVRIVCEFWPWGLRRAGSDPASVLRSLREMNFVLSEIVEVRGQLVRIDESSLLARLPEQEDAFTNLFCERVETIS
jgi:FkbM family methyltransferase